MGMTKDHLMDMEEARFEAWAAEHYPDVEPDTPEWDTLGLYYSDWQDFLAGQSYEEYQAREFALSLDNLSKRFLHANGELKKLHALLGTPQPEIVYRMAWVQAVTVMEAYLLYCARALLEHDWPLRRFRDMVYLKSRRVTAAEKQAAAGGDISLFRPKARSFILRMTFHNVRTIGRYFSAVLHVPPVWPTGPLDAIVQRRNDLVHRNGVDENDSAVRISPQQLQDAMQSIFDLIGAADMSIRYEAEWFGNGRTEENREILATALNVTLPGKVSS